MCTLIIMQGVLPLVVLHDSLAWCGVSLLVCFLRAKYNTFVRSTFVRLACITAVAGRRRERAWESSAVSGIFPITMQSKAIPAPDATGGSVVLLVYPRLPGFQIECLCLVLDDKPPFVLPLGDLRCFEKYGERDTQQRRETERETETGATDTQAGYSSTGDPSCTTDVRGAS